MSNQLEEGFSEILTTETEENYVEIDDAEETVERQEYWGEFFKDVENLVMEKVDLFFARQEMHCGGPISKKILHSPPYITRVLNTDISNGVDAAYEALGFPYQAEDFDYKQKKLFDEAQAMVSLTLINLAKSGVPKEYAGGVLLMYLELVMGVDM
jgi:hypothetical protein